MDQGRPTMILPKCLPKLEGERERFKGTPDRNIHRDRTEVSSNGIQVPGFWPRSNTCQQRVQFRS